MRSVKREIEKNCVFRSFTCLKIHIIKIKLPKVYFLILGSIIYQKNPKEIITNGSKV